MSKVGHEISRSTVRRILREQGTEPAPERLPRTPWSKSLRAHWEAIVAADFFTVEVWTRVGLIRSLVFFVLDLSNPTLRTTSPSSPPHSHRFVARATRSGAPRHTSRSPGRKQQATRARRPSPLFPERLQQRGAIVFPEIIWVRAKQSANPLPATRKVLHRAQRQEGIDLGMAIGHGDSLAGYTIRVTRIHA